MKKYLNYFIFSLLLVFTILIPSTAKVEAEGSGQVNNDTASVTAQVASKEEVIYATLDSSGKISEIYAVNILNVLKSGTISDHGDYSDLKNLTNTEQMDYKDHLVSSTANEGRFYYQGTMNEKVLPWDVTVSYYLDGKEISAKEIAGSQGNLEIRITTKKNAQVDEVFYKNYILQVSVTLDSSKCRNITADGATIANSGTDKLINFTVLPNSDGNMIVNTDVEEFEMEGITFSAVPYSMSIEIPDTSEFTNGITSLSDSIAQFNDGVLDLEKGVGGMNDGAIQLKNGSAEFKSGFDTLDAGSDDLIKASASIRDALNLINKNLVSAENLDLSEMAQLPAGLTQLADGLNQISTGMTDLASGFSASYQALDQAIATIPEEGISEEAIQKLVMDNPDSEALNLLLANYQAAQTIKETYKSVSAAFEAVQTNLPVFQASIDTISGTLTMIKGEIDTALTETDISAAMTQLTEGISTLASNYNQFDSGLGDYIGGVSKLNHAYSEVHNGIVSLAEGTGELNDGIGKLAGGSQELNRETKDMPEQMDTTIDSLLSNYENSDFAPVSFLSADNKNVKSVQFVMKTEKITMAKTEKQETIEEEPETVWTRLVKLFQ
jgi:putative membrane protein